jgi:hypothetical protein
MAWLMVLVFALDLVLQPLCGAHELIHTHADQHVVLELTQPHSEFHLHSTAYSCVHHAPCIPATTLLSVRPLPKSRLSDRFGSPPQRPIFVSGPFRPPCLS